jgi:hypothetical protein
MPTTLHRGLLARLILACLAVLVWSLAPGRRGSLAAPPAKEDNGSAGNGKAMYYGSGSCKACHSPPAVGTDLVQATEYKTWSEQDKHSQAYHKLTEQRAVQIGKRMGISEVWKDDRCLNCHAANVPRELRAEGASAFRIEDGVSCDACHGPASKWFGPHILESWRTTPWDKKEALGMRDVRDSVKRSRLCLSCHVGNVAERKLVTHEMYAAGHPPLPGFEIATFSDKMPRHWRYLKVKGPKIQAIMHFDPHESELTKLAVVGNVVALQAAADLLAAAAKEGTTPKHAAWPEFALFDCAACHHELQKPSWRQEAGYSGKPGRPRMAAWSAELVPVALAFAAKERVPILSAQFTEHRDALSRALDSQPFGRREEVAQAAGDLAKWSEAVADELARQKFDTRQAARSLSDIARLADRKLLDYDSARQIAWTVGIIQEEVAADSVKDQQVHDVLRQLEKELHFDLPSGTGRDNIRELGPSLKNLADYEPRRTRSLFQQLSRLLARD